MKKETVQEKHQRTYIAAIAKKGAAIKRLGKMCSTCAFKLDSDANMEPHNVETAFESVAFQQNVFNCHIESGKDKGCPCVGFLHASQFYDQKIKSDKNPSRSDKNPSE